jgi:hypothetical protein
LYSKAGSANVLQLVDTLFAPGAAKYFRKWIKGKKTKILLLSLYFIMRARFKPEKANDLFSKELKKLIPKAGMTEVDKVVLRDQFKAKTQAQEFFS